MTTITEHEVLNHGVDNCQYFQGCGVSFTTYTDVATGIGCCYAEAYDDALESLAQQGYDVSALERQHSAAEKIVQVLGEDCFYYVSIRVK